MSDVVTFPASPESAQAIRHDAALRRTVLVSVLVAFGYYVTAKIGFTFALQPGSVSTLWMPNSILLAGLLLVPRRSWWIVLVAAFPAHMASEVQSGVPTAMVLSWFISNSFQALFGAFFICRFVDDRLRFDNLQDLSIFLIFGALLAPLLSSFLDVALVKLNGWGTSSYWEIWRVRCLSNILATLTLVPVIITWAKGGLSALRKASWRNQLEAGVLAAGLFGVGLLVFSTHQWVPDKTPSLLYWPLPFLLWATVRFGPRGVSTGLLLVMFLAIVGATHGEGPFVASSAANNALSIQWFLIVVSIPLLALAAVIEERRRAETAARQNEENLAIAMNAAQMGTWEWNIGDNTAKWSDETKRIFGRAPDEPEASNEEFFSWIHPDDREFVERAIEKAVNEGSPYEAEFRMPQPDGSIRWVRGKGNVLRDEDGKPLRMVGLNADITEQKRAQEALRESETRLARTEQFSLVMQTHVGLDGRWLKIPPTLCELLGYTEQELLARTFRDVTHPDDLDANLGQYQRLVRGEIKSYDVEKRYVHKDGHSIWIYLNCSVVQDDAGRPVHFVNYIRDITDRKLAEQALRESEDRYRSMIESQTELICRFLPDTTLTYVNDAYCRYFGKTRDELIGTEFTELIPETIRSWTKDRIQSLVRDPRAETAEHMVTLPDGSIRWQQWVNHAISGANGTILEFQAIGRDITERKLAERALLESEQKYRSLVEFQTELICRFRPDTTLTYVNDAYCRYFGKTREELIGTSYTELLPPSIRDWAKKETESLVQNRGTVTTEHEVVRPDGSVAWQQWVDHAIPGLDGEILELQAIGRDVTDRKLAERALLESNERNQAILRALPDLMFLHSKEGVYLDYYARDKTDLLMPPESFLGKNLREVLPAELAEQTMAAFRQLEGSVETQVLEYSLEIAGEPRHFEARIVKAEEDKVLTIVRNVTESRRAEDALRESEEKLLISNRQARELAARLITAQESERRRIALLLHDDLSQNFAAVGMAISRLKRKPPATNELMVAELDQLGAQTNELTTQIRKLSHQLHSDVLEHVGLVAALESEVAEFGHHEQIKLEFKARIHSEQIPLDVSVCLYRIAIEALRNVCRHSGARSASVALAENDGCFTLEVSDSGKGFDVERAKRGSGLGLISAEERVKLLQGSFVVRSKPQGGTVLTARIPVTK